MNLQDLGITDILLIIGTIIVPIGIFIFNRFFLNRDRKPKISKIIYYPNHKDLKFTIGNSKQSGFHLKNVVLKKKIFKYFYKRINCHWELYGTGNYDKDFFVNDIDRVSIGEFNFDISAIYKIIVKTSLGKCSAIYYPSQI